MLALLMQDCRLSCGVGLFLGDEFVLDLCFLGDPPGRWIACLSKGCTKHFLEKTLVYIGYLWSFPIVNF